MKLTEDEIETGLRLASEATPGPWEYKPEDRFIPQWSVVTGDPSDFILICDQLTKIDDAFYIAFANPLRVKAMLEELRELRQTIRWTAQTVHQAYHIDQPGAFYECPKSICKEAVRQTET